MSRGEPAESEAMGPYSALEVLSECGFDAIQNSACIGAGFSAGGQSYAAVDLRILTGFPEKYS